MSGYPITLTGVPSVLAELTAEQQSGLLRVLIWASVVLAVSILAYFIVGKLRGREDAGQPQASELLSNFRELHSQGKLDEQEYRTIKTLLAARLQNEIKDTGEKG